MKFSAASLTIFALFHHTISIEASSSLRKRRNNIDNKQNINRRVMIDWKEAKATDEGEGDHGGMLLINAESKEKFEMNKEDKYLTRNVCRVESSYSFQQPATFKEADFTTKDSLPSWTPLGNKIGSNFSGECVMDLSKNGQIVAYSKNFGSISLYEISEDGTGWLKLGQDLVGQEDTNYDQYRNAVSLSGDGNVVALGASWKIDEESGEEYGYTRVFSYDWDSASWLQKGQDIVAEKEEGEFHAFGYDLSLSEDGTIVAGVVRDNHGSIREVWVYRYNNIDDVWEKVGQGIEASRVSLSFDGRTLAAKHGASVSVYSLSSDDKEWRRLGNTLIGENPSDDDEAPISISISPNGSMVAVEGLLNGDVLTQIVGYVRVFTLLDGKDNEGEKWIQVGERIEGESFPEEEMGNSGVSLSDDGCSLAVGGWGGLSAGFIRVYTFNGEKWIQRTEDIKGQNMGDDFGSSVSLSNDGMIVAGCADNSRYFQAYYHKFIY